MLPKIAEKVVTGTGARVAMTTMDLGNGRAAVEVPTLEISPAVRQKLLSVQPMYSRAPLLHLPRDIGDQALCDTIKRCGVMLGSVKHVRLVAHLYDIATGKRVAGRYANDLVQIALDAEDVDEVADHESFHFAEDRLLDQREKTMLLEQFAPGTELHYRVQDVLVRRGDLKLARHCQDAREAAAQGFALWRKGDLDAAPSPIRGIFSDILTAIRDVLSWLRSEVLEHRLQTPEAVFQAFTDGRLARRHEEARERYERAALRASPH